MEPTLPLDEEQDSMLAKLARSVPGPNELAHQPDAQGKVAGFRQGLWHGFIAPFTFLVSLFNPKVHVYEVHNNGGWYNFGFLLGMSMFAGGGRGGRRAAARNSRD